MSNNAQADLVQSLTDRFTEEWTADEPRIEEFLPHSEPLRFATLASLVGVDQELRLRGGRDVAPLDYVSRFPELKMCRPVVVWERQAKSAQMLDQVGLGGAFSVAALVQRRAGNHQEALTQANRALEILEPIASRRNRFHLATLQLTLALERRARTFVLQNKLAEARADVAEALQFVDAQNRPRLEEFRKSLMER